MAVHSRNELILINFVVDSDDSLLSHQADVVRSLAGNFDKVTVITGRKGNFIPPINVHIIDLGWKKDENLRNIIHLYKAFLSVVKPNKSVVFSHMTDVQAAFLSPITWITRTPHYLWYAHKQLSPFLKFAKFFIGGVLTSTTGSCPLSGRKVTVIGQGVDPLIFNSRGRKSGFLDAGIHIGRADPSKNLRKIFEFTVSEHLKNVNFNLLQVGGPSTLEAEAAFGNLCQDFHESISSGVIKLHPSSPRGQVPNLLSSADFFVHAYEGSLDKTLIESTLARLPVITLNQEYHAIFGAWSGDSFPTLQREYEAMKNLGAHCLEAEIERRFKLAESSHSYSHWIEKITKILKMV